MRIHPHLPIFLLSDLFVPVIYIPGSLALVDPADVVLIKEAIQSSGTKVPPGSRLADIVNGFLKKAGDVAARRKDWLRQPYQPECLTVYLSNQCNLQCVYCFAAGNGKKRRGTSSRAPQVEEGAFTAAAELVARYCRMKNKPFRLVLHGGGEPTLHWRLLQSLVRCSKKVARKYNLSWEGYLATNGMISTQQARWLGRTFTRIGVSCDGPPDIQNRQRSLAARENTAKRVEQTIRSLTMTGTRVEIRTTVTPETMHRQQEIVEYLVMKLGMKQLRFEPAYTTGSAQHVFFKAKDAQYYTSCYFEALEAASALGAELTFSGIRLNEIHGAYCNILRQVLHLTTNNQATACFLCVDGEDSEYTDLIIGGFDPKKNNLWINQEYTAVLQRQAGAIPDDCHSCFACYHCARSCPEKCSARREYFSNATSFRCRVNQAIGRRLIETSAKDLLESESSSPKALCLL